MIACYRTLEDLEELTIILAADCKAVIRGFF